MTNVELIWRSLGFDDAQSHWLDTWQALGPGQAAPVPQPDEIERLLVERCDADPADAAEIAAHRPDAQEDPELWWVIERTYRQLTQDMGGTAYLAWPRLPEKWGTAGRLVYLYAMLAAMPETLGYHREHKVADELSNSIFADVGEKLRLNRILYGRLDLDVALWFSLHFRGAIYRLGRLQFNIEPLRISDPALDHEPGAWSLGVHIPGSGGAMSAEACRDSFSRARSFFSDRFGEFFSGNAPVMTCTSWLLDPQLREFLPADSNIVAFQDLFTLAAPTTRNPADDEKDILRFVFDHVGPYKAAALPRNSSLRRILADGLAQGRRWQARSGWVTDS